jgi:predicted metal-dependent phosphoesterase TrpH
MFADLHLHSVFSDGTDTPNELVLLAKENDIKVISIADHDSLSAYENISSSNYEIKIIPSVEISTRVNEMYIHILGYYVSTYSKELLNLLKITSFERTENTRINYENAMNKEKFDYSWNRILELNKGKTQISGVHIVNAMQKDNFKIKNIDLWDMFHKYFRQNSPSFISSEKVSAYDAIDVIKKSGGIPIIAHPKSIENCEVIYDLIGYGVKGLEVYHPTHTKTESEKYREIAEASSLYISGGTDWHGKNNRSEISQFGMCGLKDDTYPILHL